MSEAISLGKNDKIFENEEEKNQLLHYLRYEKHFFTVIPEF